MIKVSKEELLRAVNHASDSFGNGFVPENDQAIKPIIADAVNNIILQDVSFTTTDQFDNDQSLLLRAATQIITKSFIHNNPGFFNENQTMVQLNIPIDQMRQLFVLIQAVVEEIFDYRKDLELMKEGLEKFNDEKFDQELNDFLKKITES